MIPNESSTLFKTKKEENKPIAKPLGRHRPGIVPNWVGDSDSENESTPDKEFSNDNETFNPEVIRAAEVNDRRLKRLENQKDRDETLLNERLKLRREIYKSEVIEEDADNKKTKTIRRNHRVKKVEEIKNEDIEDELLELIDGPIEHEDKPKDNNASIDYENYDNDDYEQEIEDNQNDLLMRPVFISKEDRINVVDKYKKELEENELNELKEKDAQIRKHQTKELIKKIIEKENSSKEENKEEMPDDSDNLDDLEEYEKWKLRELKRIKRQIEEDKKKLSEILELERRRNLTDEQRREENLRLGSDDTLRPFKSKINFLQKYYHKGAFFQDVAKDTSEHIYNRDFNLPTWEDKIDRSGMPQILAKRRGRLFKKGQSKYTHLTAEDTSNFDPSYRIPDGLANRIMNNLGGYKSQNQFDLRKR